MSQYELEIVGMVSSRLTSVIRADDLFFRKADISAIMK